MRPGGRFSHPGLFMVFILAMLLCSCSTSNSSGGYGPPVAGGSTATPQGSTATPTPAPCATHATTTAEAWVSGTTLAQVKGIINGAAETVLSNFVYPLGLPNEGSFGDDYLAALAWSPDGQHLAVAVGVNLGPTQALFPYIVDTQTHAVTRVMLPATALRSEKASVNRVFAWADKHTLLIFGGFGGGNNGSGGTVSYSYDITQNGLTPLPGVTAAYEGVVRCSTLFYLEVTPLAQFGSPNTRYKGSALLHRYNLTTQSEIGSPITLGDTSTFNGAEGDVTLMGWDASLDGTRLAYQQTSASLNGSSQILLTSKFFAANADGSGATAILPGALSDTPAFLAISPDGKQVAMTNAQPTPTVLSGSMSGGAAHYYQPDAAGPPVWLADSAQFEAALSPGYGGEIELWALNTVGGRAPGIIVHAVASVPTTLP